MKYVATSTCTTQLVVVKTQLGFACLVCVCVCVDHIELTLSKTTLGSFLLQTNNHFYEKFQSWAAHWPTVRLLNDGTSTNEVFLLGFAHFNKPPHQPK